MKLKGISTNLSFPRTRESMWSIFLDPRLRGDDEKGFFRGALLSQKYLAT